MEFADVSQNELFELLFESSYSNALAAYRTRSLGFTSKQDLRTRGLKRLDCLIDTTSSSSNEINLENIALTLNALVANKEGSLFAINFPINGEVNCLGKANLYVLVLKHLGRDDLLKKVRVKYTPAHIWLSSTDGIEVNNQDCCMDSNNNRGLNSLLAANFYSVAFHSKNLALERKDTAAHLDYLRFRSAACILDADIVKCCESGKAVKSKYSLK